MFRKGERAMATKKASSTLPSEQLTRTTWRCWLGWAGVVLSDAGICSIALEDSPEALHQHFSQQFPTVQFADREPAEDARIAAVQQLVDHPDRPHNLPLDKSGTDFQQEVWDALQAIPPGTTSTYQALADQLGKPKSVRAVANACGKNPWAIAIPCHRVIGSNGSLTGYRWGVERKKALLEREAALPEAQQLSIF